MKHLELILEDRELTDLEQEDWIFTKSALDTIYFEEEKHWQNRAKQKWLEEGDNNTKYFHTVATHRAKTNKILSLDIDGNISTSQSEIAQHIQQFYKNLLGQPGTTCATLSPDFWDPSDKLTKIEQQSLEVPFSLDEIKNAVFTSEPNGAPGPDGFTFKFYQAFWELISSDLYQLCMHFHGHKTKLTSLNRSIICLIPKEHEAKHITKFRPISLVNCSFKIISKILTFRLESIMHRIIDTSQAAFIKGRYILDNVILSQEIIHSCQADKAEGVIVKVDFEKAYDKINWHYLISILENRGFGSTWIQWINEWLISSQSCVNINGDLTDYFFCKRGVRQGDPLSPYLYILAADTLSKIFQKGRHAHSIVGLGPPVDNNLAHTNCHYADDTIIFLQANETNIENTWWALIAFEAVSGIKVNYSKTSMYPINIPDASHYAPFFRCKSATFPMQYLGLPLHTQKLSVLEWNFLIDKIDKNK